MTAQETLHTITYASSARKLFFADELLALLEKSRTNNQKHRITGMLLYKSGNFMQAIEGPKGPLYQLYRNICADPTHHSIIKILDEPITAREFSDWSMAFADISKKDLSQIPGYSDFLNNPLKTDAPDKYASDAKRLLSHFRKGMR